MEVHISVCLKGSKAICEAVGENHRQIAALVKDHGLPAWQRVGQGSWRAMPADLEIWVRRQRNKYLCKETLEACTQGGSA